MRMTIEALDAHPIFLTFPAAKPKTDDDTKYEVVVISLHVHRDAGL